MNNYQIKILNIESHLVLVYNHSALYQTSRDIGKSIFHYIYKHFKLGENKYISEETKCVMEYLNDSRHIEDNNLTERLKKNYINF